MQITVDPANEEIISKAITDKDLISHLRPGKNKISPTALMNAVTYEFLRRWYESKEGKRESN